LAQRVLVNIRKQLKKQHGYLKMAFTWEPFKELFEAHKGASAIIMMGEVGILKAKPAFKPTFEELFD
jgi:hypothetical protein